MIAGEFFYDIPSNEAFCSRAPYPERQGDRAIKWPALGYALPKCMLTGANRCCWMVINLDAARGDVVGPFGLLMKTKTCVRCLGVVPVCAVSLLCSMSSYAQTPPNAPTSTASALPEPPPAPPQRTPPNAPIPPVNSMAPGAMPQAPWPMQRPSMWGPLVDGRMREEPYWYGKDLGLALASMDVGTLILLVSGQKDLQLFNYVNFAAAHVFMGPIFHWAYGYTGRGFGALALNTMLPLFGGFLGLGSGSSGGLIGLMAAGVLGAQAIDVFALAHGTQRISVDPPPRPTWRPTSVGIMPWVDSQRTGLSVIGQF